MKVARLVLFALLALFLLQNRSYAAPTQPGSSHIFLPTVLGSDPLASALGTMVYPVEASTSKSPRIKGNPAQGIHIKPIGAPTWQPVDFHIFSAPMGTAETGFAEAIATLQNLLPPPHHALHPELTIGPGVAHPPPYDTELAEGVANLGFREDVNFAQAEFTGGNGVFVAFMNVPAPGTIGSSPDFASGPIISNDLFPIKFSAVSIHNNQEFGPFESTIGALDEVNPPFAVDGHSHFPQFSIDSFEFYPGTKINGSYRYVIDMIDSSGNGWHIEVHITVTP